MVATVFEPASENGQKGMDELHEQTVNLLAFQELPKNVFDIQVAFNMVARYGPRSNFSLEGVAQRIRKHYRHIAPGRDRACACRCCRRRSFTATASLFTSRWKKPSRSAELSQALGGEHVAVSSGPGDLPTDVSAAGQEKILVSLTSDPSHENGVWLWATTDNLRISALTAVECAESMTASRPKGQIQ